MAVTIAQLQNERCERVGTPDEASVRAQGIEQWPLPGRYFRSRSQIERLE